MTFGKTNDCKSGQGQTTTLVKEECLRLVLNATPMAAAAILVASTFISYMMKEALPPHLLHSWLGFMLLVAATRVGVFHYFNRTGSNQQNQLWERLCILISLLTGMGWGLGILLFTPYLEPEQQLILALILVAYLAGGLTTHFPMPVAFACLFFPILIPLLIRLFELGGKTGNLLAIMLIVFAIFVLGASRRLRTLLLKTLQLHFDNQALTDKLQHEKLAGEKLNHSLKVEIRERLKSEKNLLKARQAADLANRAKSNFLSSMSHEIRTPMNAILGFAQLMEIEDSGICNRQQRNNVQNIIKAGNHLLELINEILDLSKIEAGELDLSLDVIPFSELFNTCQQLVQPMADRCRVSLLCNVEEFKRHYLHADYTRTKQALLNLMSNAVKYNHTDGRGQVQITCQIVEDNLLQIKVKDNGLGIALD